MAKSPARTPDAFREDAQLSLFSPVTETISVDNLETESLSGRAVATDDSYVAVATAANRFLLVETAALGRDVQIGKRLSLLFSGGRLMIDNDRGRER